LRGTNSHPRTGGDALSGAHRGSANPLTESQKLPDAATPAKPWLTTGTTVADAPARARPEAGAGSGGRPPVNREATPATAAPPAANAIVEMVASVCARSTRRLPSG